jgi:hypothetical protein
MSAKLVPTFADRGCRVVSATDPHGCILGFLDRHNKITYFQSYVIIGLTSFQEMIRDGASVTSTSQVPASLMLVVITESLTKLRGFSPQANYTDRATAACWRS